MFQLAAFSLVKNDETIIASESMESQQRLFKVIRHVSIAQINDFTVPSISIIQKYHSSFDGNNDMYHYITITIMTIIIFTIFC